MIERRQKQAGLSTYGPGTGIPQPMGAGKNFSPAIDQNRAFLLYRDGAAAIPATASRLSLPMIGGANA